MPHSFSIRERHALEQAFQEGEALECPGCSVPLDRRPVPPRPEVSYVRDRLWLVCPSCYKTAVLDRREAR